MDQMGWPHDGLDCLLSRLSAMADALSQHGARLPNLFGFLDGVHIPGISNEKECCCTVTVIHHTADMYIYLRDLKIFRIPYIPNQ